MIEELPKWDSEQTLRNSDAFLFHWRLPLSFLSPWPLAPNRLIPVCGCHLEGLREVLLQLLLIQVVGAGGGKNGRTFLTTCGFFLNFSAEEGQVPYSSYPCQTDSFHHHPIGTLILSIYYSAQWPLVIGGKTIPQAVATATVPGFWTTGTAGSYVFSLLKGNWRALFKLKDMHKIKQTLQFPLPNYEPGHLTK